MSRTLTITGSGSDPARWEVGPFAPGKLFWRPPGPERPPEVSYRRVVVRVPCRLDATLLDPTRLRPTSTEVRHTPGIVGFTGGLYSTVEVELTEGGSIDAAPDCHRPLVARHVASVLAQVLGYRGGLRVRASGHGHSHVGLGSTSAISNGIAIAIDVALGMPLELESVVRTVAYNYAEEGDYGDDYLVPGLCTGASGQAILGGGAFVVSSDCTLVARAPLPAGSEVVMGIPPSEREGVGVEAGELGVDHLSWLRRLDRFPPAQVCYWILMDYIPAMIAGDLPAMGAVLRDVMLTANKGVAVMTLDGSTKSLQIVLDQRRAGVEICFMSSAGPALAAITKGRSNAAEERFRAHGCRVLRFPPSNRGFEILERA